jgi:hypothetical protein
MAQPINMRLTPQAAVTVAVGHSTDAASEFWQRLPGGLHVVRAGVPRALALHILETRDTEIDAAIAKQLDGFYAKRVSA